MSSPPRAVLVVVACDSGGRGHPALRGRTAARAAAIADGARAAEKTRVLGMRLGERDPHWAAPANTRHSRGRSPAGTSS